jgi:hypothetical protein
MVVAERDVRESLTAGCEEFIEAAKTHSWNLDSLTAAHSHERAVCALRWRLHINRDDVLAGKNNFHTAIFPTDALSIQ